jgi:hypothetical protein
MSSRTSASAGKGLSRRPSPEEEKARSVELQRLSWVQNRRLTTSGGQPDLQQGQSPLIHFKESNMNDQTATIIPFDPDARNVDPSDAAFAFENVLTPGSLRTKSWSTRNAWLSGRKILGQRGGWCLPEGTRCRRPDVLASMTTASAIRTAPGRHRGKYTTANEEVCNMNSDALLNETAGWKS